MSEQESSTIKAREHLKQANRHIARMSKRHAPKGFLAGALAAFEAVTVELQAQKIAARGK